ncbi:MAG: hypothetical protein R3A46_09770 [Thermomicrobiales bacterium]
MKAGTAASISLYLSERREAWNGKLTLTIVSDEEIVWPIWRAIWLSIARTSSATHC